MWYNTIISAENRLPEAGGDSDGHSEVFSELDGLLIRRAFRDHIDQLLTTGMHAHINKDTVWQELRNMAHLSEKDVVPHSLLAGWFLEELAISIVDRTMFSQALAIPIRKHLESPLFQEVLGVLIESLEARHILFVGSHLQQVFFARDRLSILCRRRTMEALRDLKEEDIPELINSLSDRSPEEILHILHYIEQLPLPLQESDTREAARHGVLSPQAIRTIRTVLEQLLEKHSSMLIQSQSLQILARLELILEARGMFEDTYGSGDAPVRAPEKSTEPQAAFFDPNYKNPSKIFIDNRQGIRLLEIIDDTQFPYGVNRDLHLLMEHLPVIVAWATRMFEVDLQMLPFGSKLQLLKFLVTGDTEVCTRLQAILKGKSDEAKRDFLISFFACSEDQKMGTVLLALAEKKEADVVFASYARLIGSANDVIEEMLELQKQADSPQKHTRIEFFRTMLSQANAMLRSLSQKLVSGVSAVMKGGMVQLVPDQAQEWCTRAAKSLHNENTRLQAMRTYVKALPRSESAELNLYAFAHAHVVPAQPVKDVMAQPIGYQIRGIVAKQFKGSEADFEAFCAHPRSYLCYALYDGELLGSFGVTQLDNGAMYIDWFTTNPESTVAGLAEAVMLTGIRNFTHGYCALVAPHVAASSMFIERMGGIAYGSAMEGQKTYLQARALPEEKKSYLAKEFTEEELQQVREACDAQPLTLVSFTCRDRNFYVARVELSAKTYTEDVNARTPDGHVYRFLEELNGSGERWVLSRYIPSKNITRDRQVYYCVFENNAMDVHGEQRLAEEIQHMNEEFEELKAPSAQ